MQDLLPHYERELAELLRLAEEFEQRYPRVAGRMSVTGELLQDPHVERLLQAFALIAARLHGRLDDDYPFFVEAFFDLVHPDYLRSLPARAIACFVPPVNAGKLPGTVVLERGYELYAPLAGDRKCEFRTTSETQLLPLRVLAVRFRETTQAPAGTHVPKEAIAFLSIELELRSSQPWRELGADTLRFYLDGPRPLTTVLRDVLTTQVLATLTQDSTGGAWLSSTEALPRGIEFHDEIGSPPDARDAASGERGALSVHRLLTDYFAFPEKFNFIDLPLPRAALGSKDGVLILHLALGSSPRWNEDAASLRAVTADNLRLGCVPVINLMTRAVSVSPKGAAEEGCPVIVDAQHPGDHEVYAIDRVRQVRSESDDAGPDDEDAEVIPPLFSLQHARQPMHDGSAGLYWLEQGHSVDPSRVRRCIRLVDENMAVAKAATQTLSIDLRATNGTHPSRLKIGALGGDLFSEAKDVWQHIRLLTPPTRPYRFPEGKDKRWRLLSGLSINALMLRGAGIDALRQVLDLQDLSRDASHQHLRDSLVAIDFKPAQAFLDVDGFCSLVRGADIELQVDDADLTGVSLPLFADVLCRFFALCTQVSSFVQLKIVSSRTGAVLARGRRRAGQKPLL